MTTTKLNSLAEKFNKAVVVAQNEMFTAGEQALKDACSQFFKDNPDIYMFGWRQFEPWRDGEESEFEVFVDPENVWVNDVFMQELEYDAPETHEKMMPRATRVAEFIQQFEAEVLKTVFGQVEVLVYPDRVEVEEYIDG